MTKPKLLLIEDDKNTLDGLVKILTRDGFSVSGVMSGYDALHLLTRKKFDIVVTDMKLPGMGGLTLIQEVRKMGLPIAIVVITAYSSENTAAEVTKYGADYFLAKPVNIEELESVLEKLCEKQALAAQNLLLKEKLKCGLSPPSTTGNRNKINQCDDDTR
ncbi:MAG: response regulator [Planctomycetia bacterium]|nr:response regulator [Planctomycetia bacterium]